MLEVIEVIRKSEQGMGSAYFCSGSDGANYWVKGESAQREFQVNEWLAGHLAKEFGLPIAHFCLIRIDEDFSMYLPVDKSDIGAGVAFASTHVVGANELQRFELKNIPSELKRDLLVFDYWVQNADRTIGNPNLLWLASESKLIVIDHNLAFDDDFSEAQFFSGSGAGHIFSDVKDDIFSDLDVIARYKAKMEECMPVVEEALSSIPSDWNFISADGVDAIEIDYDSKRKILDRFRDEMFWGLK